MKHTYSYLLLSLILMATFQDAVVYGVFYANRSYIAAKLCERPQEPMAVCGGSCVLGETLAQQHEDESPLPLPAATASWVFLADSPSRLPSPWPDGEPAAYPYHNERGRPDPYLGEIFRPPPGKNDA